ncbi:MAG: flagellin [Candidatus Hydrogenedentota bacterium]
MLSPRLTASNESALVALGGLKDATRLFSLSTSRLSTGLRVQSPSDDPGSFAFANRLQARQRSYDRLLIDNQASRSLVQTANSGIETILDHLQTIRTLAVSSSSGASTTADRNANQATLDSLRDEILSIAQTTEFNSKILLGGSYASGQSTLTFQVGADSGNTITLNIRTLTSAALGIDSISVSTQASASGAITGIDSAINIVTSESATTGSADERLEIGADFLDSVNTAYKSAINGALDADLAEETVAFAKASVLRQTSSAALAQANLYPQNVLAAILPGK